MLDKISKIYNFLIPLICFIGYLIYTKSKNIIDEPNKKSGLSKNAQIKLSYLGIVAMIALIIWTLLK